MTSRWNTRDRSTRPHSILFPILPHTIASRVDPSLADTTMRGFVQGTTTLKDEARGQALIAAFGSQAQVDALRRLAGERKRDTLSRLDHWLEVFADTAFANGIAVHFAPTGEDANAIVLDIARSAGVKTAVKAKSMVTEELGLLDRLLAAGIDTIETDLGELVLQLDDDAPSHLVTPMIHKDRHAAARALDRLETASTPPLPADPQTLTRRARHHLRERFRTADLGITGANMLVAETGEVVTCTNEGNGRLSAMCPRVHIAVTGIEKVVPDTSDLALYLELLAKSSTGQPLTIYTSFVRAPRQPDEANGPDEVHVVLVDNGRARVLADPEFRDALGCIRCGACLNTCPVYRTIGGHAYGSVWPGPIGAVLTPLMRGETNYPDHAWASTLCGACREACPIDIDLPRMLVALRTRAHRLKTTSSGLRLGLKVLRIFMGGRLRWRFAMAVGGLAAKLDLGPASSFATHGRVLPPPAKARFSRHWKRLSKRRSA
jgi:L-lactate dehydrogenase complex protein LldF